MWSNNYIGISYKANGRDRDGLDCWGLARLIYSEQFKIDLPSFSTDYNIDDTDRIKELIAQYSEGWETKQSPESGDLVLFRILGEETHLGICVSSTHFIHVREGMDVAVESLESPKWSKRISGYFKYSRHKSIVLNAVPHPLKTERVTVLIEPGTTLDKVYDTVISTYNIPQELCDRIHILVNGIPVHKDNWSVYILKETDVVEYRAVAGKSAARMVLTLVVAYIAFQLAGPQAGAAAFSAAGGVSGGTAATVAAAVANAAATAAVLYAGSSLINAILPIRPPADPTDPGSSERQLMTEGGRNAFNPYGAIPVILGKVRVTPPQGARTYVEYGNNPSSTDATRDSYLKMLLVWGYGPLSIDYSSFRIGDTPITSYNFSTITSNSTSTDGSTIITLDRQTEPTSTQLADFNALYSEDVTQIYVGSELTYAGGTVQAADVTYYDEFDSTESFRGKQRAPSFTIGAEAGWTSRVITKTTQSGVDYGVDRVTISLHFPSGLRRILTTGGDAGKSLALVCEFEVRFRYNTGGTWGSWSSPTSIVVSDAQKDAVTYNRTFTIPTNEKSKTIEVAVRRITPLIEEENTARNYYKSFLQTITAYRPNLKPCIDPPKPTNTKLAKTALKIKANENLNGQIEGVNAVVQSICRVYSGGNWNTLAATSNPAALFLHVLTHPGNPQRVESADESSKINFTQLQYWYNYCQNYQISGVTVPLQYNGVIGAQRGVLEVLRDICAAGRASPALVDGKWSVVIDEVRSTVIQHFTPHNSWGFESTKALPKIPDALKVTFYDEANDYQEKEIIVPGTGFTSDTAELFESISVPGVTNETLAEDFARWHYAQIKLRPEVYTINTDIEYLVCNRGDKVRVTHDVPMWGLASGRVKNRINASKTVISTANNRTTNNLLDNKLIARDSYKDNYTGWLRTGVSNDNPRTYITSASIPVNANTFYTFSCVYWSSNNIVDDVYLQFTDTGWPESNSYLQPFTIQSSVRLGNFSITDLGNGYKYCVGTFKTLPTTTTISGIFFDSDLAGVQVFVSRPQLELGTAATTYDSNIDDVISSNAIASVTQIELDEPVYIDTTKSYTIRIRNSAGDSITRNITNPATTGTYSTITVSSSLSLTDCKPGDLFMFGELNKESQELLVLSIEPAGGQKSARLTLVDYGVTDSYNIFTGYRNLTGVVFSSNITLPPVELINSLGTLTPTIIQSDIKSDESTMEVISPGVFRYNMRVPFTNPLNLPITIDSVEGQIDRTFATNADGSSTTERVSLTSGGITFKDVEEGKTYKVRLRYVTKDGRTGPWTSWVTPAAVVGKTTPPSNVTNFTAVSKETGIQFNWTKCPDIDYLTTELRYGTSWSAGNVLFNGNADGWLWPRPSTANYTFWIKHIDVAGNESTTAATAVLNYTSAGINNSSITLSGSNGTITINNAGGGTVSDIVMPGNPITSTNVSTYVGSQAIDTTQIANNAITATKFASGIEPITVVSAVPGTKSTNSIFNTTDNKLYRWNGSSYSATIPSSDISGTLTSAQIASVAASQITGQLTNTQLEAIAAAKVTGQITGTQITDGAISTAKLAAGSVTASTIAADTITSAQIAANAITSAELAAGAVVAGKIAAGSIQAGDIAAGTITGDRLAANTITASQIASNTITAGQIAAGAIGATQIAAGTITARELTITNTGNSINFDPNTRDVTAWTGSGISIVTDTSGPAGTSVLECSSNSTVVTNEFIPLDTTRNYEFRIWIKQASGTSTTYLTVAFYDSSQNVISPGAIGWPSYGTFQYFGLVNQTPSNSWTEYRISFGPNETAQIPSNAKFVRVGILANYSGTGAHRITGVRLMLKSDANLIVDGSIITSKLAAGSVVTDKLAAGSVVTDKLAAGSVVTDKLAAGSITASKLTIRNNENIIPDSGFYDSSWWGWGSDSAFISNDGTPPNQPVARYTYISTTTAAKDYFSPWIIVENDAYYRVKYYIYISPDAQGWFAPSLHFPSQAWYVTYPYTTRADVDNSQYPVIDFSNTTITKGVWNTFTGTIQKASGTNQNARIQHRTRVYLTAGYVEFAVDVVRVNDASLIVDGSIVTSKLAAGSVTANQLKVTPKGLNPDPMFEAGSTAWGGFVEQYSAGNAAVPSGCLGRLATKFNARDNYGPFYLDVVPGEVYKISIRVNRQGLNTGVAAGWVMFTFDASGADTLSYPIGYTTSTGWQHVITDYTVPANVSRVRLMPWIDKAGNDTTQYAWFSDFQVEKKGDSSLIVDGAVTANKINVNGSIEIASGGNIRSGRAAYNSTTTGFWLGTDNNVGKFSVGTGSGNQLIFDGTDLKVEYNTANVTVTGAQKDNYVSDYQYQPSTSTAASATATISWNTNGTCDGNGASSWYNPTTTNIGSSYWIKITRTSGAIPSGASSDGTTWLQLNSQRTLTNTVTGIASGFKSTLGTYQISTSSTGSPVVGNGTWELVAEKGIIP